MISPILLQLADRVGVRIQDRPINKSYYFDGKSIATHYFKTTWSDDIDDYIIDPTKRIDLLDHDILHEICHFIVASPEQRDLPEFGLGNVGLGCYDRIPAPQVMDLNDSQAENCNIQEFTTQMLCVLLGRRLGISVDLAESKGYASSWDEYEKKKLLEMTHVFDCDKKMILDGANSLFLQLSSI